MTTGLRDSRRPSTADVITMPSKQVATTYTEGAISACPSESNVGHGARKVDHVGNPASVFFTCEFHSQYHRRH